MDWQEIWNKISEFFVTGGLNLLRLLGVFLIGYIAIALIRKVLKKVLEKTKIDSLGKKFIYKAVTIVLWVALILILCEVIGIPITGFIAALSAIAVAIALALQDTLASLANGVLLLFTKPFKQNDILIIDGESCVVQEVRLFSTVLDTFDNRRLIVPNKELVSKKIENLTTNPIRRMEIKFSVAYDTDIKKLREVVINTMLANPQVLTDPAPELLCIEMADSGVEFKARCWAIAADCDAIKFEVLEQIFNELKRHKISIPYPQLEIRQLTNNPVLPYEETNITIDKNTKRVGKKKNDEVDDMFYIDEINKKRVEYSKRREEQKKVQAEKRAKKIALKEQKKAEKLALKQQKESLKQANTTNVSTEEPE